MSFSLILQTIRLRFRYFVCLALAVSIGLGLFPTRLDSAIGNSLRDSQVIQVRSIGSIQYMGISTQNRIQSTSLVTSVRSDEGETAIYKLAANGGLRIGHQEKAIGFEFAPFIVGRSLSTEQLTSEDAGCRFTIGIINKTIRQISKMTLPKGRWEEQIALELGEYFPQMLGLKFVSKPFYLHGAANDVKLIVVESNLLSYKIRFNGTVYARYRAILIYSPIEDLIYQAAASFTAINGEEKIRIENLQFLTDEKGNKPLFPLVDVRQYLGFIERDSQFKKEGILPMWAVQTARAYDIVNTAAVTAAEQSSNPNFILTAGSSLWRSTRDTASWLSDKVGPGAAQDFLRSFKKMDDNFTKWWEDLAKYRATMAPVMKALILSTASNALTVSLAPILLPAHISFLMGVGGAILTIYAMQSQFALIQEDINGLMRGTSKPLSPPSPVKKAPPPVRKEHVPLKKSPKKGGGMGPVLGIVGAAVVGGAVYMGSKYLTKNRLCCDTVEQRWCPAYKVCCPKGFGFYSPSTKKCYTLNDTFYGRAPKDVYNCRPGGWCK